MSLVREAIAVVGESEMQPPQKMRLFLLFIHSVFFFINSWPCLTGGPESSRISLKGQGLAGGANRGLNGVKAEG